MSYRAAAPLSLKAKALQLLALRDYSRAEMHDKLQRWLRTQAIKQAKQAARAAHGSSAPARARANAHSGNDHLPTSYTDDSNDWRDNAFSSAADAISTAHAAGAIDTISAIYASDAADTPDASRHAAAWLAQQQSQIAPVLDELQAKGWLDDRRAAEALLHQRSARLGHMRLRQALQQKGIDAETSSHLLNELAPSESERAQALWQKKFGTPPATPAERARQMRFLASRGFSAAIIQRILRQDSEEFD